jgi:hypothetical protein
VQLKDQDKMQICQTHAQEKEQAVHFFSFLPSESATILQPQPFPEE